MIRSIKAKHFMNSAFKEFSLYDNVRSIPSLLDGMKPSQRKALYGASLRGESASEIQVERLAASIAAETDYHHGTASMESTIVNMAANYTGSNNMNLFVPSGQFGSRLTKEAAASRYIFTQLSDNYRKLFKKEDECILEHNIVDGQKIEPKNYMPILPLILVNGAQGTGTGYASYIMCYNPNDIKNSILNVLDKKTLAAFSLDPWYNGFTGTITRDKISGQVTIRGRLEVVNTTIIHITELPVGVYLDQYKDHLTKLEDDGFIKDFEDRSTEDGFDFVVTCPRTTTSLPLEKLYEKFKLISRDTENYTLWNEKGTLEKYTSVEDVISRFTGWRLEGYEKRRQKLMVDTQALIETLSERLRFVLFYLDNSDEFRNKKKADLVQMLIDNEFVNYDKLLQMPIWSLTRDKIEELKKQIDNEKSYLKTLQKDTADKMYRRELEAFTF